MEQNINTRTEFQPVNKNKEKLKYAIKHGLMLAGSLILFDLIMYIFDLSGLGMFFGFFVLLVSLALYFSFFIGGGRKYRNQLHNGYINYSRAFVFCLSMAVVMVIVLTIYYFLFYYFFDPERATNEAQKAIEVISENQYIPDDEKENIIGKMLENTKPVNIMVRSLINNTITSVILAAISALFVRRKEKITEVL
ncbi:MAG: DUF4199 domain-containing protein [Bacteroidales bacterium]|jgi:hypothetical protein|nr:DUF4199 domain-containing protein [Bacteroidales bacterium]